MDTLTYSAMMILTRSFLDRPDRGILCPSPSLDKTQLSQMSCGGLDWIGFTIGYSVVVKTCRKESKICRKGYKICRKESKICTKESDTCRLESEIIQLIRVIAKKNCLTSRCLNFLLLTSKCLLSVSSVLLLLHLKRWMNT